MQIKRTLTFFDEIAFEAGQTVDPPLRKVAVVAIIDNPFAGRFERDLSPLTKASEEIGRTICRLAVSMLAPLQAGELRQGGDHRHQRRAGARRRACSPPCSAT